MAKNKKTPLTLTEALVRRGLTPDLLAITLLQGMKSTDLKARLKAADMIMKVRGDYKINYVVSGQLNHAHAHLNITDEDAAHRLKILKQRALETKNEESALDLIAPSPNK